MPPYLKHYDAQAEDGFGDFSMLVKYRFLAHNESAGDYILTRVVKIFR